MSESNINPSPSHCGGRVWENVWLSFAIAATISLLAGTLCWALNRQLMTVQEPVYDSLAYLDRLHCTMETTSLSGLPSGFKMATWNTTVCLPHLFSILFSGTFAPARWIGTLFQSIWLLVFLFSVDRVLVLLERRFTSRVIALASFGALAMTWFTNGGLGDFRMDLSLMLGYGTAVAILVHGILAANQPSNESLDKPHWIGSWLGLGAIIGATCLMRATAPVYLTMAILPILLAAAFVAVLRRNRETLKQLVLGACTSAAVASLLAGWFYIVNFEFLKYYYLVWNADANAKQPLSQSILHLEMVRQQIGMFTLNVGLIVVGIAVLQRVVFRNRQTLGKRGWIASLIAGWCAIVPIAMLIIGGAGLNPFVSMPTTAGLFVVWAVFLSSIAERSSLPTKLLMTTLIAFAIGGAVNKGVKDHYSPISKFMAAHHLAIDHMLADAAANNKKQIRFGSMGLQDIHTDSIWSAIQFDRPEIKFRGVEAWHGGTRIVPTRLFGLPTQADWNKNVRGDSYEEKRDWLVQQVAKRLDYLIMPDEATAIEQQKYVHLEINLHQVELRQLVIEQNQLELLSVLESPDSPFRYELYRVEKSPKSQPRTK